MNIMTVENIEKSFGERLLFAGLSFGISKGQKIAFIARNGVGKTTLLNIMAGRETPDAGQVVFRKNLKISYLPQENELDPGLTIEQTILATDNPVLKIIDSYRKALQNPDDKKAYQAAFDAMERHQAWDFETHYKQILSRLKFDDLSRITGTLSGGQQRRLALALALLNEPGLLILDEPTNHLDLDMIEWLEQYLTQTKITLFMVTHDRYFLERVCDEIIELDRGKIYKYTGNYSYYLEKKQARIAVEAAGIEKARNLYRKELEWIRRTPMARTSKAKYRVNAFEKIKEEAHKNIDEKKVQLEINIRRLGSKIVELHKVEKAFGGKPVIRNFSYTFKRGEKTGIIGANGSGKSTLLQIITGKIPPDKGKVVTGDTVYFGYYTQQGISFEPGQKVIDIIREYGDYIPLTKGRKISAAQLLERFLFDRKQQYDYVEKLSGGEKKRLLLCTVLIGNPNFLILDEPTNDLDIITLNVLEDFLSDFPGNLLVVSHDRYFIDKTVEQLLVIEDGHIRSFPGNYSDYLQYVKSKVSKEKKPKSPKKEKPAVQKLTYSERKEKERLESEIEALQHKKKLLEQGFVEGGIPEGKIYEAGELLRKIIAELEAKEMRWLELEIKGENH